MNELLRAWLPTFACLPFGTPEPPSSLHHVLHSAKPLTNMGILSVFYIFSGGLAGSSTSCSSASWQATAAGKGASRPRSTHNGG